MKFSGKFSARARKFFFVVHLWLGLILGAWFSTIGLTGSVLAWMPELLPRELLARYPYQKKSPAAAQISVAQVLNIIGKKHPEIPDSAKQSVILPSSHFPHFVFIKPNNTNPFESGLVLIDPYSGQNYPPFKVKETTIGWLVQFHVTLTMGIAGLLANGIFSLFATLILLSGLWLWWPSNIKQLKARLSLKRGRSLRRTATDLHNMLGIYLYGVLLLLSATAVLMVANQMTRGGVAKAVGGGIERKPPVVQVGGSKWSDDDLLQKSREHLPDSEIENISRSLKPDQPFQAHFHFKHERGVYDGGDIFLDPYTRQILETRLSSGGTRGEKFMAWTNALHYGHFNLITQLLYTLTGLLPLSLYVTGLVIWWKRLSSKKAAKLAAKTSAPFLSSTCFESKSEADIPTS